MPSVTINKGKYWVGDPKTIFEDWVESPSCTYRAGPYTYHAFYFSESNAYVAAIPEDGIDPTIFKTKKVPKTFMTFDKPTVFYEHNGVGHIGSVEL